MKKFVLIISTALVMMTACRTEEPEEVQEEEALTIYTADTGEFTMDWFRFGTGEKTFVILPGLSVQSVMGSAEAIESAYSDFCEDYTVYVFDRRKELPQTYTIEQMASDTAEVFRMLSLHDVCLFGASQGGMIAMVIAMDDPELVSDLVLGSTQACTGRILEETLDEWIRAAQEGDAQGLYASFGKKVYPEGYYEQYEAAFTAAAQTVTAEDLERFPVLAGSMYGFDVTDRLKEIQCPVLFLRAEDDAVLGPDAGMETVSVLESREDCRIMVYNGYGHAAFDLAPDYKQNILEFLK